MSLWWRGGERVEAFRWTADADQEEDPRWAAEAERAGLIRLLNAGNPWITMVVQTPEGVCVAKRGDWIVREEDGSLRVASDRLFRRSYGRTPGGPRLRLCG